MEAKEKNKLERLLNNWVIVHNNFFGRKEIHVGKLEDVGENGIALSKFSGSFEKGALASMTTLPYESRQSSVYRIYNKDCEIIYENKEKKPDRKY
jgi:hypothetical protein